LDLSLPIPKILRPGGVTREHIEAIIGPVDLFSGAVSTTTAAASPGQHARHYSPATPAFRFGKHERAPVMSRSKTQRAAYMVFDSGNYPATVIIMPQEPSQYAHDLYARLRELDARKLDAIYIEMPPDEPKWLAVRDRLIRATEILPR